MKYNWILLALLSMLISGLGVIYLKYINDSKYDNNCFLLISFIFVGIFSSIILIFNRKNYIKKYSDYDNKYFFIVFIFAFILLINSFCMQYAMSISPNIGYTHAIINFNVILSIIAGYFLFNQKINKKVFLGIIIALIVFTIIAFNSN